MLATLIHDQAVWVKWLVFLLAIGLLVTLSPITPFTTEDGIRDPEMSRGLGDVYKRQQHGKGVRV